MLDRCVTDAADCVRGITAPQSVFYVEALRQLQTQEKISSLLNTLHSTIALSFIVRIIKKFGHIMSEFHLASNFIIILFPTSNCYDIDASFSF